MNKIEINGEVYVKESEVKGIQLAEKVDGMPYVIVRTYSAGVFAGFLKERNGKEGVMLQARRLWYWDGANSLSELAMKGVSKPENCKFPCELERVELTEIIEVDYCTEKAMLNIKEVPEWKS